MTHADPDQSRSRMLYYSVTALFLLLGLCSVVDAQCPTLPSGYCFVDCTRSVYRIVCENITGNLLFADIQVYTNTTQKFELAIWNSDRLTRLGQPILFPVPDQVVRLYLDNLVNLQNFPELKKLTRLLKLHIMNSPKMSELPIELLPPNLQTMYLHQTGIKELYNLFEETKPLDSLTDFAFSQGTIVYIQPNFFKVFPKLKVLQLVNNTFNIDSDYLDPNIFAMEGYLDNLEIRQNNYLKMALKLRRKMVSTIVSVVKMAKNSRFNLSDNYLPLTRKLLPVIKNLRNVSHLSLRNNIFDEYIYLPEVFRNFDELVSLDLGGTVVLPSRGMLTGMPKLTELRLNNNNFGDLALVNIFEGCLAEKLTLLDLSYNGLRQLPRGLKNISSQLLTLSLAGNRLDLNLIQDRDSTTTFSIFPNLRVLDLSSNQLTHFEAYDLSSLTKLETVDLSCNPFRTITNYYFMDLPPLLATYRISYCPTQEFGGVFINLDAFSALADVRRLTLTNGFFKSSIFKFFKLDDDAMLKLEFLDLSHNVISYIPSNASVFFSLQHLKILKLGHNLLQSVRARAFAGLSELEQLDLSFNEISSLGENAFYGLDQLQLLDLFGNDLIDVDPGVLEPLPNLTELFFGNNSFPEVGSMFGESGKKLRHLSMKDLPMECVDPKLFAKLNSLRWVYLNHSQSVYVGTSSFRLLSEKMRQDPPKPTAFRIPRPDDKGCDASDIRFEDIEDNWIRIIAKDKQSMVYQQLVLSFPVCHSTGFRYISDLAKNLLCPL